MWGGHSCPLPLTLFLLLPLSLVSPSKTKPNVKIGGQECPPHTIGVAKIGFIYQQFSHPGRSARFLKQ
jgi:hypothetical protein